MEGFLLINKPVGISSAQCITYIKKIIGMKKGIGHAGTLDPFAQGLLIIGIGRAATKLLPTLMTSTKRYRACATLGVLSDTLDVTGAIIKEAMVPTSDALQQAVNSFGNSYYQIPPIYSALKINGQRLYQLARKKKLPESQLQEIAQQKERLVQLYELKITAMTLPQFEVEAEVSHGTYIRSLMNDIAQRAGTYARTDQLVRLSIGKLTLAQATDLYALQTKDDVCAQIMQLSSCTDPLISNLQKA